MSDERFEWDNRKAETNFTRHGVSFAAAREAFLNPFAIEWPDDRFAYGEDRHVLVGMVEGYLLYVAYTQRGDTIRVISAREAQPRERRRYLEANV